MTRLLGGTIGQASRSLLALTTVTYINERIFAPSAMKIPEATV
jgi:hypothetical protein